MHLLQKNFDLAYRRSCILRFKISNLNYYSHNPDTTFKIYCMGCLHFPMAATGINKWACPFDVARGTAGAWQHFV